MQRVVCQVLSHPQRWTFRWSSGTASFEPYHLEGALLEQFLASSRALQEQQPRLAAADSPERVRQEGLRTAQLGHALYQALFPAAHPRHALLAEIVGWLEGLRERQELDGLDLLGDAAEVPWTLVYDSPPSEAAFAQLEPHRPCWQPFWGLRYNLTAGARYNPLTNVHLLESPSVLLVLDPSAEEQLDPEQRTQLRGFTEHETVHVADSLVQLESALREKAPDILYLFTRTEGAELLLGANKLSLERLRQMLAGSDEPQGPWNNLIVVAALCAAAPPGSPLAREGVTQELLALQFPGVIAPAVPLGAAQAHQFGAGFLEGLLNVGDPLGQLTWNLRSAQAPLGLLFSTHCPAEIQVSWAETPEPEESDAKPPPPLPETPFRPLRPFDREDRALFVGRESETVAVSQLVDAPATRLLVLHGRSGVGKSSLLSAAVIPTLEDEAVGYRALCDRSGEEGQSFDESACPVVALRATSDLLGQLSLGLTVFAGRPCSFATPTGRTVSVDLPALLARLLPGSAADPAAQVYAVLHDDPAMLGRILSELSAALPYDLLLLIEQAEEVFTLVTTAAQAQARKQALAALASLAAAPTQARALFAVRTEYAARLADRLHEQLTQPTALRSYLLGSVSQETLLAALLQPTLAEVVPYSSEAPAAKYQVAFEPGLAEQLAQEILRASNEGTDEALPLLQALGARLYERMRQRGDGVIRHVDLASIGGVAAGVAGFINAAVQRLPLAPREQAQIPALLGKFAQQQAGGLLVRSLVETRELTLPAAVRTPWPALVEMLESADAPLLASCMVYDGAEERLAYSLSDDALLPWAQRKQTQTETGGWRTGVIDTLWIMIPLLLLTLSGLFAVWRNFSGRPPADEHQELVDQFKKVRDFAVNQEKVLAQHQQQLPGLLTSRYFQQIELARQAWQQNDLRTAQQVLNVLRLEPLSTLRGFDWYHLKHQVRGGRLTILGHRAQVGTVALSSDGKLGASASSEGHVALWDPATGKIWHTLPGKGKAVHALAFTPDAKLLAVAGAEQTISLWPIKSETVKVKVKDKEEEQSTYSLPGEPSAVLKGHTGAIRALATSYDVRQMLLASAGEDKEVKLWSLPEGKLRETFKDHDARVIALAFAPGANVLASGAVDGKIILWDGLLAKKMHELKGRTASVQSVSFAPDSKTLVSTSNVERDGLDSGTIRFWDVEKGSELPKLLTPEHRLHDCRYSTDGKYLFTVGHDNAVQVLDAARGTLVRTLRGHTAWVRALAVGRNGDKLVTGGYDAEVKVWDWPGPLDVLPTKGPLAAFAVAPDDKHFACVCDDTISLRETATGKELHALKCKGGAVAAIAFGKADKTVLLAAVPVKASTAGEVFLWKVEDGSEYKVLKDGHKQAIKALAFAPDGKQLVTGGEDKLVLLWDVEKGTVLGKFERHEAPVRAVVFAPSQKQIASGDADGDIHVWDTATQTALANKEGKAPFCKHTAAVTALAFAGDDRHLLSTSADRTLRRWDIQEKLMESSMRGHTAEILALTVGAKGEVIATGGRDRSVRLWQALRREQCFQWPELAGPVRGVHVTADLRLLLAATQDGSVYYWRADEREVQHEGEPAPVKLKRK